MSEQTTPRDAETPKPSQPQDTGPQPAQTLTLKRSHLVSLFAAGLGVCFFVPWVNMVFIRPSGFDLQHEGGVAFLFWAMPALAAVALVAGLSGKQYRVAGQLAALTPFAILGYGISQQGSDLLRLLEPGAWIALVCGCALFIAARR